MAQSPIQQADEDILRLCLEHGLSNSSGEAPAIVSIYSTPHAPVVDHSYTTRFVTVQFAGGDMVQLLLKDFGSSRRPKDRLADRRARELWVYQVLLAQARLGTARYYGSVWDEAQGRFWLLLEFVNGQHLNYHEFPVWLAAAGWLGRMQGYVVSQAGLVHASDYLLRYDADFFASTAIAAMRALTQISDDLVERLAPVMHDYHRIIDVIVSQPTTLVHSAYKATQILVDPLVDPPRICPIDWERAAIGPALYDLALLSDGLPPPQRDQLWDAYSEEATRHNLAVLNHDEMEFHMCCLRLHLVMTALSKSVDRRYTPKKIRKLVEIGEHVGRLVL